MSYKDKFITILSSFFICLDWFRITIFSISGKQIYTILFNYIQPLTLVIILTYLCIALKWRFVFLFVMIYSLTRIFANIPSNISRCENGKIEIQNISYTGAGKRYFLGEETNDWTVMGWVKDDCGVPL